MSQDASPLFGLHCAQPAYRDLAVAAVFSRAIASFLGVGVRRGRLCADRDYFPHMSSQSWEVKITDVGGEFIDIDTLSSANKSALEEGINETNRAFALNVLARPVVSGQERSCYGSLRSLTNRADPSFRLHGHSFIP